LSKNRERLRKWRMMVLVPALFVVPTALAILTSEELRTSPTPWVILAVIIAGYAVNIWAGEKYP